MHLISYMMESHRQDLHLASLRNHPFSAYCFSSRKVPLALLTVPVFLPFYFIAILPLLQLIP